MDSNLVQKAFSHQRSLMLVNTACSPHPSPNEKRMEEELNLPSLKLSLRHSPTFLNILSISFSLSCLPFLHLPIYSLFSSYPLYFFFYYLSDSFYFFLSFFSFSFFNVTTKFMHVPHLPIPEAVLTIFSFWQYFYPFKIDTFITSKIFRLDVTIYFCYQCKKYSFTVHVFWYTPKDNQLCRVKQFLLPEDYY